MPPPEPSPIEQAVHDDVVVIRLHRPAVLNALDRLTLSAFLAAAEAAAVDESVRAIVVTGGSDAFCTGEDLRAAARMGVVDFRAQIDDIQRLATVLRHAPKPVIAAVGGHAYGGGLEIAVNCDARIAAANARFACPEVRWNLTITNGSSLLLRRLVGDGWARELVLFGAEVDAVTARKIGLVTRVVAVDELEATALQMARTAASHSVRAMRATKDLLNADATAWRDVLDAETEAVVGGFASDETQERLARFLARRRD